MNGVAAIVQLMSTDAGVLALVPEEQITSGDHPQGTALPYLSIEKIDRTTRNILSPGPMKHVTERVQVTVAAATLPEQQAIQEAVIAAGDAKFPVVDGLSNVTVHHEGSGPDARNQEASLFTGSEDFMVRYSKPR